jgi:hypothetical protein
MNGTVKAAAILLSLILSIAGCGNNEQAAQVSASEEGVAEETGHHGEAEEGAVRLSLETMQEFGIEVSTAETGTIEMSRSLPGEVVFNPDRILMSCRACRTWCVRSISASAIKFVKVTS